MKYTLSTVIRVPREKVWELMTDPENMKHWQPGFISMELLEGKPGEAGSKTRLRYKMGKREIEMIETITRREAPEIFDGTYEANGVWNGQNNRLEVVDENSTRWVSESEFRMSGFMKLIGWLFPGSFKKQSQLYLDYFKAFAEEGKSVAG